MSFFVDYSYLNVSSSSIIGLWKTVAGGDGTQSTPGNRAGGYFTGQGPLQALDGNTTTRYTSYGRCNQTEADLDCGEDTGLHLTLLQGPTILKAFRFLKTEGYIPRDPMTVTIEGSNQTSSALMFGSVWTLIYNGSSGIGTNTTRSTYGLTQLLPNNHVAYSSYRLLVTSKRRNETCTSYAELELFD